MKTKFQGILLSLAILFALLTSACTRIQRSIPPSATAAAEKSPAEHKSVPKPATITADEWGTDPDPMPEERRHTPAYITIHHEGELWKEDFDPYAKLRHLQGWGKTEKSWPDLPYHFLIAPDGRIFEGRSLEYAPDTNTNYDVKGHVGVMLYGNFEEQRPRMEQIESAVRLSAWLCDKYKIDPETISSHRDVAPGQTVCPGKDFYRYIEQRILHGWVAQVYNGEKPEFKELPAMEGGPTEYIPYGVPEPAFDEKLSLVTHHSEVLGKDAKYYIYIPPTEDKDERFPVLYVMHGKWGSHEDWPKLANAAKVASRYRMIVVFPDGDQFSWYLDSPLMKDSQYETYISKELVDYVDANYPTVTDRTARGIMGLSMGGHGALLLAAKHPDRFGSASSLSGILKLTNSPERKDVEERLGPMKDFPDRWKANSVWDQAERFQTANVKLLFDCGEDDTKTGAIRDSRQLHERLVELKVPHIWREHRGTHSWPYWTEHLPQHFNFHQAAMIENSKMSKWVAHYFQREGIFFDQIANETITPPPANQKKVVLLGSSGSEGVTPDLFPGERKDLHVYNRGIVSDVLGLNARGISRRMEEGVFDMKPDVVFLRIGTNDIGDRVRSTTGKPTETRMVREYAKILDQIADRSPKTKVIVGACSPTGGKYTNLNPAIMSFNAQIKKLAEDRGFIYLDLFTPYANENNDLKEEYSKDGLHFVGEAKKITADLMFSVVDK